MTVEHWLGISAGATFLLAIAAFVTIFRSYCIRKEDRVLNIKSQALDEIRNWVNEAHRLMFLSYSPNEKWDVKMRFEAHGMNGASVLVAAGYIGTDLFDKVKVALECFDKFKEALWSTDGIRDEPVFLELWDSLFEVLKVVYNYKIELFPSTKDYRK